METVKTSSRWHYLDEKLRPEITCTKCETNPHLTSARHKSAAKIDLGATMASVLHKSHLSLHKYYMCFLIDLLFTNL